MKTLSRIPQIAYLCSFIFSLLSCTSNQQNNSNGSNNQVIAFDSAIAKQSLVANDSANSYIKEYHKKRHELELNSKDSSFLIRNFALPDAEAFSRDAILMLLSSPKVKYIRAYLANKKGEVKFILVGVDGRGKDIPTSLIMSKLRCPYNCTPN